VLEIDDFRLLTTYTHFRSCIRWNVSTILLTRWLLRQRSTAVSFLRSNATTLHTWWNTIKHRSTGNETRTQSIAEHLPYPRPWTRSEVSGITVPSAKELLPRKCYGKAKQKDDLEMESGRRIRHAQEVCRGRKFSVDKDIGLSVLPFVCLVVHLTHRIFLSQFYGHHLSCQSHSFLHRISLLFFFR